MKISLMTFWAAATSPLSRSSTARRLSSLAIAFVACTATPRLVLARTSVGEGNTPAAGHWARKAAELGGPDEVLIRRCLEVLGSAGDMAGVGQVYRRLERTLETEFETVPAPETQDLMNRLQQGDPDAPGALKTSHIPSGGDAATPTQPPPVPPTDGSAPAAATGAPTPLPDVDLASSGPGPPAASLPTTPGAPEKATPWRTALLLSAAAMVVALGAWVGLGLGRGSSPTLSSEDGREFLTFPTSVLAVLPFEGDGTDPGAEQFAAGVHQDILTELSRISDLTVLSRRAVEPYRGTNLGIREISAELGAGSILEGSVRWEADRVRVSVELTDAATRTQVWAGSYDRDLSGLLQAQRAVAQEIALALQATLSSPPGGGPERFPEIDPQVVALYVRAIGIGGGWPTEGGLHEEERLLREALALDPGFAAAWAALAQNFARRPAEMGASQIWTDSAMVAADRALSIDPGLAEGYLALGTAHHARGHLDLALLEFDRALALDPNLVEARHKRGFVLASQGKLDRALIDQVHALRRDPNNATIRVRTGRLCSLLGDMEAAERFAREGLSVEHLDPSGVFLVEAEMHLWGGHADAAFRTGIQAVQAAPDDPVLRAFLADLAFQAGECETAATEARRALDQVGEPDELAYYFHARTILGFSLRACGEEELGREALDKARSNLEAQITGGATLPLRGLELAAVLDGLGRREEAREWIEWAYDRGSRHLGFLRRHPMFEELRTDPEVRAILEKMQAEVDQMRERITPEILSGTTG